MAHVLPVAALQQRRPLAQLVRHEADDRAGHADQATNRRWLNDDKLVGMSDDGGDPPLLAGQGLRSLRLSHRSRRAASMPTSDLGVHLPGIRE